MKFLIVFLFSMIAAAQTPLKMITEGDLAIPSYKFDEFSAFLEKSDDTVYVINFWATWCAPCIKELPAFEKLGEKYRSQNVKVLLVSLDFSSQAQKSLIPFIKKRKLKNEVVHLVSTDANDWIGNVSPNWSGAIPATVIYSRIKRQFYERSFTFDELESELKSFLP